VTLKAVRLQDEALNRLAEHGLIDVDQTGRAFVQVGIDRCFEGIQISFGQLAKRGRSDVIVVGHVPQQRVEVGQVFSRLWLLSRSGNARTFIAASAAGGAIRVSSETLQSTYSSSGSPVLSPNTGARSGSAGGLNPKAVSNASSSVVSG